MFNRQVTYLSLLLILCFQTASAAGGPFAETGVLDLRDYNFSTDGPVNLSGEWNIYWNHLLLGDLERFRDDRHLVNVPGTWNQYRRKGLPIKWKGYATYQLTILLPPGINRLGFKINDVYSSSAYYINGKKFGNIGFPAANKYQTVIRVRSPLIETVVGGNEVNLMIHVSNFEHFSGGIRGEILMGLPEQIKDAHVRKLNISFFLMGALLIIGIYFLSLFLIQYEQYRFYFSMICLLMVFRILVIDEIEIFKNFIISGTSRFRLEYLSIYLITPFIILMIQSLFPIEFKKSLLNLLIAISAVFVIVVLITPLNIFSFSLIIYQLYFLLVVTVILYVLIQAWIRGRTYALAFTIAMSVLLAGIINDMFYMTYMFKTVNVSHYTMLACLIVYAHIFSTKSLKLIYRTESLSTEIQQINQNLENLVQERTSELERSSKRLEKQRKELEKSNKAMSRANLSRNRLFSIIGHDIRGPIGYVRQGLELLNEEKNLKKEEQNKMLKLLLSTTHKTFDLLENLMLWGRTQVGNLEPKPAKVDLKLIIEECLEVMDLGIKEKSLKILPGKNLDRTIWIDRDQLLIVVRNLLSNAIKFTPAGGEIKINVIDNQDKDELILEITDTGIGIPEKLQSKIFNPDENYTTNGTNHEKGSGLGLKLCREIIEANHGWINFTSRSGHGSVFRVGMKTSQQKK